MEAVLFDMDGVLVDSEDYWEPYESEELLPAVGLPDLDLAEITGMNYREIYDYLDDNYDVAIDREEFLDWFETTAEHLYGDDVVLLPGAQDLIDELRDRGLAVAIVSSSPPDWIGMVRDRFDLDVDAVTSADTIDGPGKPEPDVYEVAAANLGVAPGECIAVEDSVHGIESAKRAGMTVVGFRHGGDDDTDRSAADHVADSPEELRSILRSLTA